MLLTLVKCKEMIQVDRVLLLTHDTWLSVSFTMGMRRCLMHLLGATLLFNFFNHGSGLTTLIQRGGSIVIRFFKSN